MSHGSPVLSRSDTHTYQPVLERTRRDITVDPLAYAFSKPEYEGHMDLPAVDRLLQDQNRVQDSYQKPIGQSTSTSATPQDPLLVPLEHINAYGGSASPYLH